MPEKTLDQIAAAIAREFLPLYQEMTTSDLQGCIGAAVVKAGLRGDAATEAENIALETIYAAQEHPQTDEHLAGCASCMMAHDKAQPDQPTDKAVDVEVFGQMEETSVADPEGMNDRRSLAALMAVIAFSDDIGELPEDGTETEERRNLLQQNIADMFADLMHLADRVPGLDFEAALETGRMHYTAETEAD